MVRGGVVMPKPFTENERTFIKQRLMEEAKLCLAQFGVRKTTVDELGRIAIPQDVLDTLKIEPKTELEVETSRSIILSKATN